MEEHITFDSKLTASQRRRLRRKTLKRNKNTKKNPIVNEERSVNQISTHKTYINPFVKTEYSIEAKTPLASPFKTIDPINDLPKLSDISDIVYEKLNHCLQLCKDEVKKTEMDTSIPGADDSQKPRDDVKAAREAKKLAKQAKKQGISNVPQNSPTLSESQVKPSSKPIQNTRGKSQNVMNADIHGIDEVDEAIIEDMKDTLQILDILKLKIKNSTTESTSKDVSKVPVGDNLTVHDVVNTLKDIVSVAKDVENVTAMVQAMDVKKSVESKKLEAVSKGLELHEKKSQGEGKSKAELKAERRAKQEAQRAAKQAQQQKVMTKPKQKAPEPEIPKEVVIKKEKSPKPKVKPQSSQKSNWFQHLHNELDKEALKEVAINSNLHPAVIKLGVQLASRVVTGSNARCIALLDALKKMVRDYSLPAKTEFGRGLQAQLAASVEWLWRLRAPAASQVNAVKHFRHQLTQLPNNVDEFDAKKKLQEEIDRYIREQIDMAGEAISIAVRNKISNGDTILTYGCSSLIERILRESHAAGVQYRAVVAGSRVTPAAREMLRRLVAAGVTCSYVDISALSFIMKSVSKVLLGASAVRANGSVVGAAGALPTALAARAHNVPVLVACETHKFSDRVQTDAFVCNEIGDPDALIDQSDENSPLKDWRSNPNLTLLNLTYDVTPASLVTAVVTELAILPCTSAPVVLRFKTSEYGI